MTKQSSTDLSRELKLTSSESFLPQVLTDAVITQSLKLMNCTKVRLYFKLFLSTPSMPFSLSSSDPKKSTETSHSKKEERKQQLQHVLYPQQNMLVGSKIIIVCQIREFSN